MKVIILAGGGGLRLWPLSTSTKPKQFLKLFDGKSCFELAVRRALKFARAKDIVIVTNQAFEKEVKEQLGGIDCHILFEPCGKNTLGAITFALSFVNQDELFLCLCSDHLIQGENFFTSVELASTLAYKNVVLFGQKPDRIESGYGYIHVKRKVVIKFIEKPNKDVAKELIETGEYLWNTGMFLFSSRVFKNALFEHCKEHAQLYKQGFETLRAQFHTLPAISFDYAILEKVKNRKCMQLNDVFWSDVGSFDALYQLFKKDDMQNAIGKNTKVLDANRNLVISDKQVVLVDCEDLIVIENAGKLLITKRGSSQKVKEIVKEKVIS